MATLARSCLMGVTAGGSIDVIVPTYRRPDLLRECLRALADQRLGPERLVVTLRPDDHASLDVVHEFDDRRVRTVIVPEQGILAALRFGVAATRADLVAITDDDARPAPDWLERIVAAFADPTVGCVGGRPDDGAPARPDVTVGRINRVGRLVGNHNVGWGPTREVDVAIGVNMAVRASALRLPVAGVLFGTGAEPHYEVLVCAWVRALGFRLVYDPAIVVHHRPGLEVLPPGDLAHHREADSWTYAIAHNWLVGVAALGARSPELVVAYGLGVGMRRSPGVLRAVAALVRGEREVLQRVPASVRGQIAGYRRARRGVAERVVSASALRAEGAGT